MSEDDLTDDLAEVIRLRPDMDLDELAEATLFTKERDSWCPHRQVLLDTELQKVICKECGREVNAFKKLLEFAGDWQRHVRVRTEAKRRADAALARLEEILRLERNARARLKRAAPKERPPEVPWGENRIDNIG